MYAQALLFMFILCVGANDWGTVFPTLDGVQANSWIVGLNGIGNTVSPRLFETASPPTPSATTYQAGGNGLINLAPGGVASGRGSALSSRAYTNAFSPSGLGDEKVAAPGTSYAYSEAAAIDIGLPYTQSPTGGIQLSPIGVHLEACKVTAVSHPGKSITFNGNCAQSYVSASGQKIMDIPPSFPSNLKIRIPKDESQPLIANIIINEQVTTDNNGNPTVDGHGNVVFDPEATSGYVNAAHIISEHGEVTVLHAAVIRDAEKTDMLAPKPPTPSIL